MVVASLPGNTPKPTKPLTNKIQMKKQNTDDRRQKMGVRSRNTLLFCVCLVFALMAFSAQAVKFRLPLSSDTTTHYYFDNNTSSGIDDWKCGNQTYNGHRGTDFSGGPRGRAIYAAAAGTLGNKVDGYGDQGGSGFGNYVRIDHGGGTSSYYAHMTAGSVTGKSIGSSIACSEQIGGVGTSGNSTGFHLHFEPRFNGVADDPFAGSCGGPTSWWVNQGSGSPSTACDGSTPPPPPAAVTSPSIVTRTDGKIFAFGITTSGAIQYRQKTSINATWGAWVDLGGSGFTFIRALPMSGGGVAVFGMGSGNIYYRYLASSGSGIWSGWVNVGGSGFISITPIMKTDGEMALVGCGADSSIFYQEQTAAGPSAAWTGWGDLVASSFWQVDGLALPNGGAAVFGLGDGGGAWYKYKVSSTSGWSSWVNLSGSGFSRISAVMETTGKMAFFGSADDAGSPIWYQEQTGVGATAGWSGWINLGGGGYSSISGVALPGGGLAVFGCTDNGSGSSVFYKKRASETAAWSGYVDLTASSSRRVSATADANGLMSVVMRGGTGGPLWERAQTDANHWSGWVNLGNALK
jgi:hypothetical protein